MTCDESEFRLQMEWTSIREFLGEEGSTILLYDSTEWTDVQI